MVALTWCSTTAASATSADHVADALERGPEVARPDAAESADERLERVAERDPEDTVERHAGPAVGQQGAERDARATSASPRARPRRARSPSAARPR